MSSKIINIEPGKCVGDIKFGMSRGQVIDLINEPKITIEYGRVSSKKYLFLFDDDLKLKYIVLKKKGSEEIEGVNVGSTLLKASQAFGQEPKVNDEGVVYFDNKPGLWFCLSDANVSYLYETGAVEEGVIDQLDLRKLIITSICVYPA